MTWFELRNYLNKMDDETLSEEALVFDYETNQFYETIVCLDGEPEFHLTIN